MKSVQSNVTDQRHFFYTENKWLDIGIPTEVKEENEYSKLTENNVYNIYSECTDYWDEKQKKFRYNHLYRKRVLKIKSNELLNSVENVNELTNLLEEKGEITGFYADKSKHINIKGVGVWKHLNGKMVVDTTESTPEFDILHDINTYLNPQNLSEEDKIEEVDAENAQDDSGDESPKGIITKNFECCMRELNEFIEEADKPDSSIHLKTSGEDLQTVNPWYKFQKCQIEQYGFHDLQSYLISEKVEVSFPEQDDYYSKIIDTIMKKEVSSKASKVNIKEVSTELNKDSPLQLEKASITMKDKDGKFEQAIDIQFDTDKKEEDFTDTTTLLKKVINIHSNPKFDSNSIVSKVPCCEKSTVVKRAPLKSNLTKIVNDITQGEDNKMIRDMEVELKFKSKYDYSCISTFSDANKESVIKYREKFESKIKKNKRDEITSTKEATKKDLKISFTLTDSINENKLEYDEKNNGDSSMERVEIAKKERTTTNHRGLVKLISGSKYCGSWNKLGMEGCGIYLTPGGTIINGYMNDGILNGPATIYLPNGMMITGTFNRGAFQKLNIQFGDGLVYLKRDWDYLQDPKKLSKNDLKKWKPIFNREIPKGCYDTGEGFYNPTTKLIYHAVTGAPIRSVSEREEMWILSSCRTTKPKEVTLDEQLNNVDVMQNNITIKPQYDKYNNKHEEQDKIPKTNCLSSFYYIPSDTKEIEFPPDRLINVDKKSKPIEELWNNIRDLNTIFKVQIGNEKKSVFKRKSDKLPKESQKLFN